MCFNGPANPCPFLMDGSLIGSGALTKKRIHFQLADTSKKKSKIGKHMHSSSRRGRGRQHIVEAVSQTEDVYCEKSGSAFRKLVGKFRGDRQRKNRMCTQRELLCVATFIENWIVINFLILSLCPIPSKHPTIFSFIFRRPSCFVRNLS